MGATEIKIAGLTRLRKKLGHIPENVAKDIDADMAVIANDYVNAAISDAPVDQGLLKNFITAKQIALMHWEIVSGASYSAYVEFGTKSRFKAIPGIDSSKYIGKGKGDYYDFLNNILDWVKRKGIGMEKLSATNEVRRRFGQKAITKKDRLLAVAERIAFSIIKKGVKPHPFFFKQLPIAQAASKKSFKESVNKALKK
jgi:hypothetical protein